MDQSHDPDAVPRRHLNVLIATVWAVTVFWASIDIVMGLRLPATISGLSAGLALPLCLVLSQRGYFKLARASFVVLGSMYIAVGELMHGANAGFEFYWLPAVAFGITLYRVEDYRSVVGTVSFIFATMLMVRLTPEHWARALRPLTYPSDSMHTLNFELSIALIVVFVAAHVRAMRAFGLAQLQQAEDRSAQFKSAFDRAAASEKVVSEIFQGMLEGIRIENQAGRVLKQNQAAIDLLGSVEYERPWRAFGADGLEIPADLWPSRIVARTGLAQVNVNARILRADGSTRFVVINAVPLGERFEQVITTMMDVTELKKSEDLLRQTLNSTPDWIFIKDRSHRYVQVNTAYAAALGRAPEDILGRNDLDLGFPEANVKGDPERNIRGFWADDDLVLATARLQTFDNDPAQINGVERTFHTIKAPLLEPGSERVVGVLGISRDITHLKAVERQLIDSAKMASLGQMAGGVAHEINNPLAVIGGKAHLLIRQLDQGAADSENTKQVLRKIVEMTDRIAKIIKGLKTFARSGEHDPFVPVSVSALVQDSLALCGDRFRATGLTVELNRFEEAIVAGSAAQLSQVLINLLNNAHDAIETLDERWVRLEVVRVAPEQIEIAVVDSGSGLPAAVLAKLAQPFFTTKAVGRGTGLGLSISKNIVEQHGGRLYVDTTSPNTRFVMSLPCTAADTKIAA